MNIEKRHRIEMAKDFEQWATALRVAIENEGGAFDHRDEARAFDMLERRLYLLRKDYGCVKETY